MIITAAEFHENILHITDGRTHEWFDLHRLVSWQYIESRVVEDGQQAKINLVFDGVVNVVTIQKKFDVGQEVLDEILESLADWVQRPTFSRQLEQISEQLDSIGQQIQGFA